MNNSILFLGTGGDSIVVGRQLRASGGIVLRFGDNTFFLDPGPGALVRAKQFDVNPRAINAPPPDKGPITNVKLDDDTMVKDYLMTMDWDLTTTRPSLKKLRELGLSQLVKDL